MEQQVTGSRAAQLNQQKQKANATSVAKGQKIVGRAMGRHQKLKVGRKQPFAMQIPRNNRGMR
jgi:hypothetical protein